MIREEQIERVASELATALDGRPHRKLAERIVAALAEPAEDTSTNVQATVDRMRDLTESVSERNQRIERLRDQPGEVTDEMVERAAKALWTQGAARREHADYPYERLIEVTKDDLLAYARAALRAALEAGTGTEPT